MLQNTTACQLSHRGVLRVNGNDRHSFLQGLLSNDIAHCTPQTPIYAALLTAQGKFLHDMFVYDMGGHFLIDCEAERADDLLHKLNAYKLRAKVTLENMSDQFHVWAFPQGGNGLPDPRLELLGSRDILPAGKLPGKTDICNPAMYDVLRVSLGIPDGSRDMIVGKSTLSDGNFDFLNGISWTKGCYVGQELTARMHHRALVKKRMLPVRISGATPQAGTTITLQDEDIGEIRSANGGGGGGLAILNIESAKTAIQKSAALHCGSATLTPYIPVWLKL